MNKIAIMLWAVPTWVLTNLMTPFVPVTHAWKNKWFTLVDWASGRTELTKLIDSALWGQIVFLIILLSLSGCIINPPRCMTC